MATLPKIHKKPTSPLNSEKISLREIDQLDEALGQYFSGKLAEQPVLTRSLVSFQANKTRPIYRWFKYKEAFSASLVEYFLEKYSIKAGTILDPFAGSGTALFAASSLGLDATGIELLPIGQEIIKTKQILDTGFTGEDLSLLNQWTDPLRWKNVESNVALPELRITKGAYPSNTQESIEKFLTASEQENNHVRAVLRFALFCTLESVSFTRKDGQYLRWDHRSGRKQGKKVFDKGKILGFEEAISEKVREITMDLTEELQPSLFTRQTTPGKIMLFGGSCLEVLPQMPDDFYEAIITSPPYCNRYDYTRTYALELALLDVNEKGLINLRQEMLSCTVENRAKDLLAINPVWKHSIQTADEQKLLQAILAYLDTQKAEGNLNNNGIPRMVRGYFYEMACIIAECARVLKHNAPLIMVNDNVRYAGASISVDLILSKLAESLGFYVENILVLPTKKGNSSQQMGEHGRDALRKCVYIWRKM